MIYINKRSAEELKKVKEENEEIKEELKQSKKKVDELIENISDAQFGVSNNTYIGCIHPTIV